MSIEASKKVFKLCVETESPTLIEADENEYDNEFVSCDILSDKLILVKQDYVLYYTKNNRETLKNESKKCCKVLKFNSEWSFEEVLLELGSLDSTIYENLLIIIVSLKNIRLFGLNKLLKSQKDTKYLRRDDETLINVIKNFCKHRPMILQITSETEENGTMFYYKNHKNENFLQLRKEKGKNNFPSIFCSILNGNEYIEEGNIDEIIKAHNSSLIIRYLRIFNFPATFFEKLFLKCASMGSESDLKAALNYPICNDITVPSEEVINYLTNVYSCDDYYESVLTNSIYSENDSVYDFLIKISAKIKYEFLFEHQVVISTIALKENQLNILSDLIKLCDFPFPNNLNLNLIENTKLKGIIENRIEFHEAVLNENIEKINEFLRNNPDIKIVYNLQNNSAMYQAASAKKFKILQLLKSVGYKAIEYENIQIEKCDEKEAMMHAKVQLKKNVEGSIPDDKRTVLLLSTKSYIHNKLITEVEKIQYQDKIRNFFHEIYEIQEIHPVLEVASFCDHLKLIFDFESCTVDNIDLISSDADGITYQKEKWIFIGSKLIEKEGICREQNIKGVIMHEISHYAIGLCYENDSKPYFKYDKNREEEFSKIFNDMNEWKDKNISGPDDECDEVISKVFKRYPSDQLHAELIVRVPEILTRYHNENDKLIYLKGKYKKLFDFYFDHVLNDLKQFKLKEQEKIRNFNTRNGFFEEIKKLKCKFYNMQDIIEFNGVTIVTSNVPKLVFKNIYCIFSGKFGSLVDVRSIFISTGMLKNRSVLTELTNILEENSNLNIFIEYSKEIHEKLHELFLNESKNLCFILVVSSESNACRKLLDSFENLNVNLSRRNISYQWEDLSFQTQQDLLQNNVNFQNNSNIPFSDLITTDNKEDSQIFNNQLLNLLIEKREIFINKHVEVIDKNFEILYRPRKFIRINTNQDDEIQNDESFFIEIENKRLVLLSDIAGSGKTWILKNIANQIRKRFANKWTVLVDLKQFTERFNLELLDFPSFIVNNIFLFESKFESYIFKNMYKNGKVFIIFDGYDEVSPNFAEFVTKLCNLFEFNGGNQLWIATRDYFEADLKSKLKPDIVLKLEPFSEQDGIDLIATSLVLNDLDKETVESVPQITLKATIKDSQAYQNYQQNAQELHNKIKLLESSSIGFPQFYKMIIDIFRKNKNCMTEFTKYKIYYEFAKIHFDRWTCEKGPLRREASSEFRAENLDVYELHQWIALKDFYEGFSNFCDLEIDLSDYPEEEIIHLGFLNKKGEKFFFSHETFREFFGTQFIVRILTRGKSKDIDDEFCKIFIDFLTEKNFRIIRMFLNDAFSDNCIQIKIKRKLSILAEILFKFTNKLVNLSEIVEENHSNLVKFLLEIFKIAITSGKLESISNVFCQNKELICRSTKHMEIYKSVLDFIDENFDADFMKELLLQEDFIGDNSIHCLMHQNTLTTIVDTFELLKRKFTDRNKYREILISRGRYGRNLLLTAVACSRDLKIHSFLWKEFQNLFSSTNEFHEFLKDVEVKRNNMLNLAVFFSSCEVFEFTIKKLENIFDKEIMRKLLCNLGNNRQNIVQSISLNNNIKNFQERLWDYIKEYCDSSDILDMIIHIDDYGRNIFHTTLQFSSIESAEFVWNEIKSFIMRVGDNKIKYENYYKKLDVELQECFRYYDNQRLKENFIREWNEFLLEIRLENSSKILKKILNHEISTLDYNTLHKIVFCKDTKLHDALWEMLFKIFENLEDLKDLIIQKNEFENNFIILLIKHNNADIIISTLDIFRNKFNDSQFREILKSRAEFSRNLLQTAACASIDIETHKYLWQTFRGFCSSDKEFFKLLEEFDEKESNVFSFAARYCSNDVIIYMIEELEKIGTHEDLKRIFSVSCHECNCLLNFAIIQNKSLEGNKTLWEVIEKYFEPSEILEMILSADKYEDTIMHNVAYWNTKEIIDFTWGKIESYIDKREDRIKYLKRVGFEDDGVVECSLKNMAKDSDVVPYIRDLMKQYEIPYGIKNS